MPAPQQPQGKYLARDFFVYEISLTSFTNGTSQTGVVNIDTDSDFFWQKATAHCSVSNAAQQRATEEIPECTITIKDVSTGRDLMNAPVPIRNIFGTGEIPFILPVEKFFGARSQISVNVSNVSASTTYTALYLSFIGIKAFLAR